MFSISDDELMGVSGGGHEGKPEGNEGKIVSSEWTERCPKCSDSMQCILYDVYGPEMRYFSYETTVSCDKCGYYKKINMQI